MAPSADQEGPRVTPFLTKTYQLVDDHSTDEMISWNSDGTSFVVWRPAEFARDILPLFFKHNNLSSFVRQLNTYGFRKISDRWEFTNENFRRGESRLLNEIRRRKKFSSTPAAVLADADGSPTNSSEEQVTTSSGESLPRVQSATSATAAGAGNGSTQLEEENNRLRQENKRLSQELGRMKRVCSNIFNLVSDLNAAQGRGGHASPLQLLDLMPPNGVSSEHDDCREGSSTRLFGVSIRTKRSRSDVHGDDMDFDMYPSLPGD